MPMLDQREQVECAPWGLVLAAGDGRRMEGYIREVTGKLLPKQYVNFTGKHSMLEHTFRRTEKLIPAERILTIVGRHHLDHSEVQRQLSSRPARTIIVQPDNKDTCPGILLPLMHLHKHAPEAIVAVFPSDHFILEENRFMEHVALAAQAVTHDPSRIVLLAMEAQYPEGSTVTSFPARSMAPAMPGACAAPRDLSKNPMWQPPNSWSTAAGCGIP